MAECHPVAFRWVMQAKLKGAKVIHADPRFTRTTAVADMHAPIRAGSDIAFLGGLINYVINSERWNSEPFFREYVTTYTNAATIINEDFRDTEDEAEDKPLGVFSGLGPYKEGTWRSQRLRRPVQPGDLAVRAHARSATRAAPPPPPNRASRGSNRASRARAASGRSPTDHPTTRWCGRPETAAGRTGYRPCKTRAASSRS